MNKMKKWLCGLAAFMLSLPLSLCVACDNLQGMLNGISSSEATSDTPDASDDSNAQSSSEEESVDSSSNEEVDSSMEGDGDSSDSSEETPPETEGLISTAAQLTALIDKINRNEVANDITIELGADINMAEVAYTPIYEFRGVFDGKGHTISNLTLPLDGATISLTDGNWVGYTVTAIGLIGSAYGAEICNLTLQNVTADFDTNREIFIGALVGYAVGLEIIDCTVNSTLEVDIAHESVGVRNISGVAGVVGYSLDAYMESVNVNTTINYTANSYEAFVGSVLGVGNVRVHGCDIFLDISFIGDRYGHTGSVIGMERTPENVTLASMYDSRVNGSLYIKNDRGYDWGEIGQGYFYDPETREILKVAEYNEINVAKTKE